MKSVKYEQLAEKPDTEEDVFTKEPKSKGSQSCVQGSFLSLGLILLYFSLSIGLTFYQRWLLKVSLPYQYLSSCFILIIVNTSLLR